MIQGEHNAKKETKNMRGVTTEAGLKDTIKDKEKKCSER